MDTSEGSDMAKRFTYTEKWNRPWFRRLPPKYKLLWLFVLDNCDLAGVWYVDLDLAAFQVGSDFDPKEAAKYFQKQVVILSESRWWIRDFIEFQYGKLSPSVPFHKNIISTIKKAGLWEKLNPRVRPRVGPRVSPTPEEGEGEGEGETTKERGSRGEKKLKPPSDYQRVVEAFAINRGVSLTNGAVARRFFAVHGRAAKELLELCAGDLRLSLRAIQEIAAYADKQVKAGEWKEWRNLAMIVNHFIPWKQEYDRDGGVHGNQRK